jgi:O-methyltransferase
MIPRLSYIDNLMLAQKVLQIPGCIVECGVWRGGMSAGIATILGVDRHYFLFDSFEGLPPAKEVDGKAAIRWQNNKNADGYYDNCTASPDFAQRAMTLSGAKNVHLVKGWFNETLPNYKPLFPIALLRLDADWYESTMVCLESLFDRVAPNGLVLLDDYYTWDGCSKALHDFLSRRAACERIRSYGDVCLVEKCAVAKGN